MKYRCWTEGEEQYLIESYGKIPAVQIAEHLNRKPHQVIHKASKLRLSGLRDTHKKNFEDWKEFNEMLNTLRKLYRKPLVPASENPYKKINL